MNESLTDLIVEDPAWEAALPELEVLADEAASLALREAGLDPARYTLAVLACDDARIGALNQSFRGKAGATNVLSWPAFDLAPPAPGKAPPRPPEVANQGRLPLGDLAIALQTCSKEADFAATPLKIHVRHLILHGSLHLLGYDHETEADAELMEGIESRALTRAGYPDPYA